MQIADLSQMQGSQTRFITSQVGEWNLGGDTGRDISSASRGLAILPGATPTVVCSINGFGVGLWNLISGDTIEWH